MSFPPVSTTGTWKVAPAATGLPGGLNMRFTLACPAGPGTGGAARGPGVGRSTALAAVCPLASADALNCASAAGAAAKALWPGTTPMDGRAWEDAGGRTAGAGAGAELSGAVLETCRNSTVWPAPVSMVRRFALSSVCVRTICGTTRNTSSSSLMVWSLEPNRYLRMGMELSPGMPLQLTSSCLS